MSSTSPNTMMTGHKRRSRDEDDPDDGHNINTNNNSRKEGCSASHEGSAMSSSFQEEGDEQQQQCCFSFPTSGFSWSRTKKKVLEANDRLIVQELNQLSLEERTTHLEELHGVVHCKAETPEFVQYSLLKFDQELGRRLKQQKSSTNNTTTALERALFLYPSFVQDPKFRLAFLRAENFDMDLTLDRFFMFFQAKQEYFGLDLLAKPVIHLDDLSQDDQAVVQGGCVQVLPHRMDRAGRLVLASNAKEFNYQTVDNYIRACWYLLQQVVMEEKDVQQKGLICAFFDDLDAPTNQLPPMDIMTKPAVLTKAFPIRQAGVHILYHVPQMAALFAVSRLAMSRQSRHRHRTHYVSSYLEATYELLSFGIPPACLPMDDQGQAVVDEHVEWLQEQIQRERKCRKFLLLPRSQDVLLGRNKLVRQWPGNLQLQQMAVNLLQTTKSSATTSKRQLAEHLHCLLCTQHDVKFLQKQPADGGDNNNDEEWCQVSSERAMEKILQVLRSSSSSSNGISKGQYS